MRKWWAWMTVSRSRTVTLSPSPLTLTSSPYLMPNEKQSIIIQVIIGLMNQWALCPGKSLFPLQIGIQAILTSLANLTFSLTQRERGQWDQFDLFQYGAQILGRVSCGATLWAFLTWYACLLAQVRIPQPTSIYRDGKVTWLRVWQLRRTDLSAVTFLTGRLMAITGT